MLVATSMDRVATGHDMKSRHLSSAFLAVATLIASTSALAGGSAENAILVIDPTDATSMYVGNYYKNARNIPDANVMYLRTASASHNSFVETTQAAFNGTLRQRNLGDHADYVVLAPQSSFYLLKDGSRASVSAVYVSAQRDPFNFTEGVQNHFATISGEETATAFHGHQSYFRGAPSVAPNEHRYYIGAQLGYTGPAGNTVPELLTMIDRSVAADGTRPAGMFYYMNNLAQSLRNLRACTSARCDSTTVPTLYNAAASSIVALGGSAQVITGNPAPLPPQNTTDILGIMSGFPDANIAAANLTLVPGAFADHLTSHAATFDCNCQTTVAEWVRAGASGSAGAVKEPFAVREKFPSANFHKFYFEGMSLGESYLRSVAWVPFDMTLYGDPLTRPFAHIPTVNVPNPPLGPVSGTIAITPTASTDKPGAAIASYDLLVDSVKMASADFGQSLTLTTANLADGWHDVRVLAYDNTAVQSVGRWVGMIEVSNRGRSATLSVTPATGSRSQLFSFAYAVSSSGLREVRLVQNGRVLAASTAASGTLNVFGQNLGSGISKVKIEAWYTGDRLAWSMPLTVTVGATGTPAGSAPVAHSYSKRLAPSVPQIVELPASFDAEPGAVSYALVNNPSKAVVVQSASNLPYVILQPIPNRIGSEQVQFRVTIGGQSSIATVTLVYDPAVSVITAPAGSTAAKAFAAHSLQQIGGHVRMNGIDRGSLWTGVHGKRIDLHPPAATYSTVTSMSADQQVGYASIADASHAMLWTGTAQSALNLTPAGAAGSYAHSVRNGQQVGQVIIGELGHAALWSGTAGSWIDLHPAGAVESAAVGIDNFSFGWNTQVGFAAIGGNYHAGLWRGTAASWVDLHPAGADYSQAFDISADIQVGRAHIAGTSHAGWWNSTAASWVDLHPASATYSVARATDGARIVGAAILGGAHRALLWIGGAADSYIDLSAYLPPEYAGYISEANAIVRDENGVHVVGYAERAGASDVIVWTLN